MLLCSLSPFSKFQKVGAVSVEQVCYINNGIFTEKLKQKAMHNGLYILWPLTGDIPHHAMSTP